MAFLWHLISVRITQNASLLDEGKATATNSVLSFLPMVLSSLFIGSGPGYIHRAICEEDSFDGVGGIGGVRKLVQLDSSKEMLYRDKDAEFEGMERVDTYCLEGEEEEQLPFPDGTFDLVISSCAFHWVNNLPGLFREAHVSTSCVTMCDTPIFPPCLSIPDPNEIQILQRVLKPDGCFIFAMVGGATLPELRVAMVMAELEREGGVSPHVGPFVSSICVPLVIFDAFTHACTTPRRRWNCQTLAH